MNIGTLCTLSLFCFVNVKPLCAIKKVKNKNNLLKFNTILNASKLCLIFGTWKLIVKFIWKNKKRQDMLGDQYRKIWFTVIKRVWCWFGERQYNMPASDPRACGLWLLTKWDCRTTLFSINTGEKMEYLYVKKHRNSIFILCYQKDHSLWCIALDTQIRKWILWNMSWEIS